jgi:hypothetical protein
VRATLASPGPTVLTGLVTLQCESPTESMLFALRVSLETGQALMKS